MTSHSNIRSHKPVAKTTPQYKADDGSLSAAQLQQIKKRAPQGDKRSPRSSLLDRQRAQNK